MLGRTIQSVAGGGAGRRPTLGFDSPPGSGKESVQSRRGRSRTGPALPERSFVVGEKLIKLVMGVAAVFLVVGACTGHLGDRPQHPSPTPAPMKTAVQHR